MRFWLPITLVTICLAGCGGSKTSAIPHLVATTTVYSGNLYDQNHNLIGTATTTLNPNDTFSITSTYGPGFAFYGSELVGSATSAQLNGGFFPTTSGSYQGFTVFIDGNYPGGGQVDVSGNTISGGFQFGSQTRDAPPSYFDGTAN